MFRAILELLLTIAVILIARAVLTGLMKGISSASFTSFQDSGTRTEHPGSRHSSPEPPVAGLLHKDPICGTFVAESTAFRRQVGRDMFFYCSEACRHKHALSAH